MRKQGNKHEKGQSLVEFALALPILILILSGLVDIGRVYFAFIFLEEAAAEAALFLSIEPSCLDGTQCAAPNNALWRAQNSGSTQGVVDSNQISVTGNVQNPDIGATVTVTATYPFRFITPGIAAIAETVTNGDDFIVLSVTATHIVITE